MGLVQGPDTEFCMMKVILVTGGTGLVGQAVQNQTTQVDPTIERWIFLSQSDGDLTDLNVTRILFDKYKPTHVLHLAARVGGLFRQLKEPVEFFRANSAINDNVLACAHESNVEKVVSCLSTCIFPDKTDYPIDETMLHLGPPHASNIGYAIAKRNLDILNQCYAREYGRCFTSVIPTNVYGPHDNFHLGDSHVIPALIHKCYLAMQNNTPFIVGGSGSPFRQFIYSHDLAKLMIHAVRHYDESTPLILSGEEEVSIREVAYAIAASMQFNGDIIFDKSQPDGQFKKTASNSKLRRILPSFRFTQLNEGIALTVAWFLENYKTCRK